MAAGKTRASRSAQSRRLAKQILKLRAELAPRLPEIDPQDMVMILHAMLQKTGRAYFLRAIRPGVHVI